MRLFIFESILKSCLLFSNNKKSSKNSFCNITAHRLFTDCGNTRRAECKGRQIWRGLDFFPLLPRLIYGCVICEPPNKISGAYKKVRLSCVYILRGRWCYGLQGYKYVFISLPRPFEAVINANSQAYQVCVSRKKWKNMACSIFVYHWCHHILSSFNFLWCLSLKIKMWKIFECFYALLHFSHSSVCVNNIQAKK